MKCRYIGRVLTQSLDKKNYFIYGEIYDYSHIVMKPDLEIYHIIGDNRTDTYFDTYLYETDFFECFIDISEERDIKIGGLLDEM